MSNTRLSPEEQKRRIEACARVAENFRNRLRASGRTVEVMEGSDGGEYKITFPLTNAQRSPTPQPDDPQDPGDDDEADEPEAED